MSITISSATNIELEILYAAIQDLKYRPKPNEVMDLWRATIDLLLAQVYGQLTSSSTKTRRWGGNEQ